MPTYEYRDPKSGEVIEEWFPSAQKVEWIRRDGKDYKRAEMPSRISVPRGLPSPLDMNQSILEGYRRLEERGALKNKSAKKKENIKKIWK